MALVCASQPFMTLYAHTDMFTDMGNTGDTGDVGNMGDTGVKMTQVIITIHISTCHQGPHVACQCQKELGHLDLNTI